MILLIIQYFIHSAGTDFFFKFSRSFTVDITQSKMCNVLVPEQSHGLPAMCNIRNQPQEHNDPSPDKKILLFFVNPNHSTSENSAYTKKDSHFKTEFVKMF